MNANRMGRRRFLRTLAAALLGLATASAPADAGWGRRSNNGGWGGFAPVRGVSGYRYQAAPVGRSANGYAPRGYVVPAPGPYAPQPRLYVPPVRVYYAPPAGYVPPMI